MQDMLDIDIRTEVATVVGGVDEFTSLMSDLPSLDLEAVTSDEIPWFGGGGAKWSTQNDVFVDVSACVNPNSVHSLGLAAANGAAAAATTTTAVAAAPAATTGSLNSPKTPQLNLNTNHHLTNGASPAASPKERKSHLTFSPNTIKVPTVHETKRQSLLCQAQLQRAEAIKKDLNDDMKDEQRIKQLAASVNTANNSSSSTNGTVTNNGGLTITSSTTPTSTATLTMSTTNGGTVASSATSPTVTTNTIKLGPGIGGLTFANSFMYAKLKQNNGKIVTSNMANLKRASSPHYTSNNVSNSGNRSPQSSLINGGSNSTTAVSTTGQQKIFSRSIIVQKTNGNVATHLAPTTAAASVNHHNITTNSSNQSSVQLNGHHHHHHNHHHHHQNHQNKQHQQQKVKSSSSGEHEFPKPAYSYSCLIAMALKNSRAGSLPVSEIYSFMCEHFPYFKKAPNGWKNSVRHNLSLNKCFEKIEKPATNGGQRKGCLWAMNPARIVKMDEEIQKWSRKDPQAIRKAMVFPEHLEQLERGEMKHGSTGDSELDGADEDTEDNSDSEEQDVELDDTVLLQAAEIEEEEVEEEEEESADEEDRNSQVDYEIEVNYYSL